MGGKEDPRWIAGSENLTRPRGDAAREIVQNFRVVLSGCFEYVEGMVGAFHHFQRGS